MLTMEYHDRMFGNNLKKEDRYNTERVYPKTEKTKVRLVDKLTPLIFLVLEILQTMSVKRVVCSISSKSTGMISKTVNLN